MTATSRSPLTMARVGTRERRAAVAVDQASPGATRQRLDRAAHREQRRLQDVERVDLGDVRRRRRAHASALARISTASRARAAPDSSFESRRPAIGRAGSRITAAATTGPASGPRPASSTPATSSIAAVGASACNRPPRATRSSTASRGEPAGVDARATSAKPANSASSRRRVTVSSYRLPRGLREVVDRRVVLQQLGHDEAAGEHVRQPDPGQQQLAADDACGHAG